MIGPLVIVGFSLLVGVAAENVQTTHGPVKGFNQLVDRQVVKAFLGIPFAKPPTGRLRFRAPQSPEQWSEPLKAVAFPKSCIQFRRIAYNFPLVHYLMAPNNESEDCLYLNVWAPSVSDNIKRAVMVWIHGGGNGFGSTSVTGYSGERLSVYGDVVVVSIQYRLGALGFLYLGNEEVPGNMGLLDQQLALGWVKENIHAFGGDHKRVTLFGESAGGFNVGMHMFSPGSQPLFQHAILQSGGPLCSWGFFEPAEALQKSRGLLNDAGCQRENEKDATECLISIGVDVLVKHSIVRHATIDGNFISNTPADLLRQGRYKKTSIMGGFTSDEGSIFLAMATFPDLIPSLEQPLSPWPFDKAVSKVINRFYQNNSLVKQAAATEYGSGPKLMESIALTGDMIMTGCCMRFFEEYSKQDNPVFMYSFNYRSKNHMYPEWMGVTHAIDVYYIFGRSPYNFTEQEEIFSHRIMKYVSDFARSG